MLRLLLLLLLLLQPDVAFCSWWCVKSISFKFFINIASETDFILFVCFCNVPINGCLDWSRRVKSSNCQVSFNFSSSSSPVKWWAFVFVVVIWNRLKRLSLQSKWTNDTHIHTYVYTTTWKFNKNIAVQCTIN